MSNLQLTSPLLKAGRFIKLKEGKMSTTNFISSKQLSDMQLKEPMWFINEIMPEGITLVIAKPKVGKSALILYLMIQIALQKKVWDTFETKRTSILYLPFDDPMRRFKDRLHRICEAMGISDMNLNNNFSVYNKSQLDKISFENMEETFASFKNAGFGLVIIDTFNQGFDFKYFSSNAYTNDSKNMYKIKEVTERLGLSLIIIHHEKKGEKTDSIDAASGSAGITAAVDTIWRLTDNNFEKCKILEVTGKDVECNSYRLEMEADTFLWSLLPSELPINITSGLSPEQKVVYEYVKDSVGEISSKDIAAHFGKKQSTISQSLRKLQRKDYVFSPHYGKWKIKESLPIA